MKLIHLPKGENAIVDDADYDRVSCFKWHANSDGYVVRQVHKKRIALHRLIAGAIEGQEVDHINRNPLDNRRENLRICSNSQNQANKDKYRNNKSGFKGVYWVAECGKWKAQLRCYGQYVHIGYFSDPVQAAMAYNEEARKRFGDFANLNVIPT